MGDSDERRYPMLVLSDFETKNDLILTAQEEKKLRRIRNKKGYIKMLKARTRPSPPPNLQVRPAQSNEIEIKKGDWEGPGYMPGYMPNFAQRVANASPAIKADFAALLQEKATGRVPKYRERMFKIRQAVTPPAPAAPVSAAPRAQPVPSVTVTGPSGLVQGPPTKEAGGMPNAKGGAQLRNFSNPYAI